MHMAKIREKVRRISEYCWEIPASARKGMRVPARIYGDDALVASMDEAVFEQAANVAMLPVYENTRSACPTGIPDTVSP